MKVDLGLQGKKAIVVVAVMVAALSGCAQMGMFAAANVTSPEESTAVTQFQADGLPIKTQLDEMSAGIHEHLTEQEAKKSLKQAHSSQKRELAVRCLLGGVPALEVVGGLYVAGDLRGDTYANSALAHGRQ